MLSTDSGSWSNTRVPEVDALEGRRDALAKAGGVDQVLHANAGSGVFVGIGGADAASRGAQGLTAAQLFFESVEQQVIRHHQVGAGADVHIVRSDAQAAHGVELLDEGRGVDHHAVAQHDRDSGAGDA